MKISLGEQERSAYEDESKIKNYINEANLMGYKLILSTKVFEVRLKSFFFIYLSKYDW